MRHRLAAIVVVFVVLSLTGDIIAKDISTTADGHVIALISCPTLISTDGELKFPSEIGSDPTFSTVLVHDTVSGFYAQLRSITRHDQVITCQYSAPLQNIVVYTYRVERKIVKCGVIDGASLQCELLKSSEAIRDHRK